MSMDGPNLDDSMPSTVARDAREAGVNVKTEGENLVPDAFAAQFEVLDRLRRGGQQTVRVEHVTVQAGGRAIVGLVATTGGGGLKSEEQPHAIANAPGVEMPSPDPERSTVPSTSDAERQVPTARGDIAGRSEG